MPSIMSPPDRRPENSGPAPASPAIRWVTIAVAVALVIIMTTVIIIIILANQRPDPTQQVIQNVQSSISSAAAG